MSPDTAEEVRPLNGVLFRDLALDEHGQPLQLTTLEQREAAETAPVEWIALGPLKVFILDADAEALVRATGAAVEDGPPTLCLKVRLEGALELSPACGDLIAIDGGEPGAALLFTIQWTHEDSVAQNPFAGDQKWERDPALDDLAPGEALLVQALSLNFAQGETVQ